jgi:two-component system capsular synthesis sensor histidine kinase RcsC
MIERANELYEPILPSSLASFFDQSGLSNRVQNEIQINQEIPESKANLKVLAVDDSVTNLIVLKSQLQKIGVADVVLSKNGEEAIQQIQLHEDIDMVFMDFNMPVLDGPSATKELRDQGVSIPIIGLTALDTVSPEVINNNTLFNKILTKPAGISDIKESISHYLSLNGSVES